MNNKNKTLSVNTLTYIIAALALTLLFLLSISFFLFITEEYSINQAASKTNMYKQQQKLCEESLPRNQQCVFSWKFETKTSIGDNNKVIQKTTSP